MRTTTVDATLLTTEELLDTVNLDPGKNVALNNLVSACANELSSRKLSAENRLWNARMELQYAENEVRLVNGLPLVMIHGADGSL